MGGWGGEGRGEERRCVPFTSTLAPSAAVARAADGLLVEDAGERMVHSQDGYWSSSFARMVGFALR